MSLKRLKTITLKIPETNSCEIAHTEKSLISDFQEFYSSISTTFILARRRWTRLSSMKFSQFPDIS